MNLLIWQSKFSLFTLIYLKVKLVKLLDQCLIFAWNSQVRIETILWSNFQNILLNGAPKNQDHSSEWKLRINWLISISNNKIIIMFIIEQKNQPLSSFLYSYVYCHWPLTSHSFLACPNSHTVQLWFLFWSSADEIVKLKQMERQYPPLLFFL